MVMRVLSFFQRVARHKRRGRRHPTVWYFFVYPTLGQYLRVSVLPSAAAAAAAEGLNRFSGTGTCSEIRRDETVAVSFRWGQDPAKEYDVDDYTICP